MLQDLEFQNKYQEVIHWNEEGDSFTIRNTKEFSTALLPKYFRTGQFTSFTRQLRAYGFIQKKPWGSQKCIRTYAHFLFHRDHPECIEKIKRCNNTDFSRKIIFSKQGEKRLLVKKKNQESEAILQSSFKLTEKEKNHESVTIIQPSQKLRDGNYDDNMLKCKDDFPPMVLFQSLHKADKKIDQFDDNLVPWAQIPVSEKKHLRDGIKHLFPCKLYKMLQDLEFQNKYQEVIHWNEEGDSFTIRNTKEFSTALLPKYFRTGQFTSFTRQLRAYGFIQKKPWGSQKCIRTYAHFLFHRDHPECIEKIKRCNNTDFSRKIIFSKQGEKRLLVKKKNQESEAILQSSFKLTEKEKNHESVTIIQPSQKLRDGNYDDNMLKCKDDFPPMVLFQSLHKADKKIDQFDDNLVPSAQIFVGKKNEESEAILQSSFDSILQLPLKLRDETNFSLSGWNAEDESLSNFLSIEKDSSNRTISLGSLLDLM